MSSKRTKFSKVTAVKEKAREVVGQPRPTKVLPRRRPEYVEKPDPETE